MRSFYLTLFVALSFTIGIVGCTDVGVNPKSSATGNNVLSEEGGYKSFLAKLYAGLSTTGQDVSSGEQVDIEAGVPDVGSTQYMRLFWELQELPTDEAVIAWDDQTIQDFNTMSWNADDAFNEAMYSRIFFQVAQVNEFLRQSQEGRLDERGVSTEVREKMSQWRAEARFLRALSYWHAVDLYGDVPLVAEDFPRGAEPPEQSTREEVFNFVESELRAITEDTDGGETLAPAGQATYGRADKGAAWMVLAKLYMNAEVYVGEPRYSDAIDVLNNIIDASAYQLEENYQHLFLADNHTADGLIFAVPHDGQNEQSFGGTTFLAHASIGGDANANVEEDFGLNTGWFGLRTTPSVVDRFSPADARPEYPSSPSNQFYTAGQSKAVQDLMQFSNGYMVLKYQNVTSGGEPGSDLNFVDIDYPMFRLADAYLMYAEAVERGGGGDEATALQLINDLRERAGLGRDISSFSDVDEQFLLNERSRELLWEGHRRTDLIRFGEYTSSDNLWAWKGGVQGGQGVSETLRLYPIPTTELLANPNMEQNDGY